MDPTTDPPTPDPARLGLETNLARREDQALRTGEADDVYPNEGEAEGLGLGPLAFVVVVVVVVVVGGPRLGVVLDGSARAADSSGKE